MDGRRKRWVKRFVVSDGLVVLLLAAAPLVYAVSTSEAPSGFDNLTNGFESQAQLDADREAFEEREEIPDGLGPVYNAQACSECHQNPVAGATSQVTELRVGRLDIFGSFSNPPGGSLINDRAINPAIQERVSGSDNVTSLRASLNTLGDGFVEAIPDSEFTRIQSLQPSSMRGQIITVPVLEGPPGTTRIARFGWKNQHASLLSFSADAYLNEMGITSPLQPTENTSYGVSVAPYDTVPDPEDAATPANPFGPDVEAFARFMRSTKTPPRDLVAAATQDAQIGEQIFLSIGCATCHTPTITTAPPGTVFNGGKFVVPDALGNKVIHPYGDFMLHNIGTGDGILQNGPSSTRNKMRTAPLWGLRTRARMSQDLLDFTRNNSILFHDGEANGVINNYLNLSTNQKNQLIAFLNSL